MLLQRPVISGRYSGSPFVNMLSGPLDQALRPLFSTLVHMGELVRSILSEEPRSDRVQVLQLEEVIRDVEAHRYLIVADGIMLYNAGHVHMYGQRRLLLLASLVGASSSLMFVMVLQVVAMACDTLDRCWSFGVQGLP